MKPKLADVKEKQLGFRSHVHCVGRKFTHGGTPRLLKSPYWPPAISPLVQVFCDLDRSLPSRGLSLPYRDRGGSQSGEGLRATTGDF